MNCLLDTNILLRLSEPGSPFHPICKQAVSSLLATGKQARDTRLVAFMEGHDLTNLLTLNAPDFSRFKNITCLNPENISPPASS